MCWLLQCYKNTLELSTISSQPSLQVLIVLQSPFLDSCNSSQNLMFIYPFQTLFPRSLLRLRTSLPVAANWIQQTAATLGLMQCPTQPTFALNFWLLLEQTC